MKKNLFWSMLAMSGMLFATSCSQDELVNESAGDFVSATFNIGTADGIGSRATIGNGTKADKVVCAVFDEKGEEMDDLRQTLSISGKTAKYSIRLAKGQDYRVAFFAYNEAAAAYDVTDMKNIAVKADQKSNVEDRDAFTAYVDVAATVNAIEEDVTLKRPFAQLNLGVDATEWADAVKAGVTVSKSYIKVSNVYNAFSAYDNAVVATAQEMEMEFDMNKIPTEELEVDLDRDGNIEEGEYFKYLALNYLLVGNNGAEKSLTDVEFVWETEDGKTNNPTSSFINIPVQRNYRTNIIGKLLTSPADFNIFIDERFDNSTKDDYIVEEGGENGEVTTVTTTVATAAEIQVALDAATSGNNIIKFEQDIDANSSRAAAELMVVQREGVNIVIDGCGFKFDGQIKVHSGSSRNTGYLAIQNVNFETSTNDINFVYAVDFGGANRYSNNINVENCTFKATSYNETVVGVKVNATQNLKIKNCTATNMHSLLQAQSCDANIEVDNVTITDCKNGISLGNTAAPTLTNSTIEVSGYGVRADGDASRGNLVMKGNDITATYPVAVRKLTTTYNVAFEGENTLTAGQVYEVILTNNKDEDVFEAPTGSYTISGAESFNVYPENAAADQPKIATTAAKLTEFLADNTISEILLGEGAIIEGTFAVTRAVTISSVSADNKATIKGRINVSGNSAGSSFNNIKFAINDATKHKNTFKGAPYQYPASVMIECVATSFEGCEFVTSLDDGVCGINYGNSAAGQLLTVNNCTFKGDFYAIRSRTMFSITNSEFDIYTTQGTLAAVWSWGGGGTGTATSVTFTNNTNMNTNKIYSVQMSASNYSYDNIKFNIQKNTDFLHVSEGVNPARDFTGKTFTEGSETF